MVGTLQPISGRQANRAALAGLGAEFLFFVKEKIRPPCSRSVASMVEYGGAKRTLAGVNDCQSRVRANQIRLRFQPASSKEEDQSRTNSPVARSRNHFGAQMFRA
jgi:hypothetical protein